MKYTKQIYIIIFLLINLASHAQINDRIKINKSDFTSEKVKVYDKIDWKSDYRTKDFGSSVVS